MNLNFIVLSSVVIISTLSLLSFAFLFFSDSWVKKIAHWLLAVAVGALFGDAFIHILPEAYASISPLTVSALTLGGVFIFFLNGKSYSLASW